MSGQGGISQGGVSSVRVSREIGSKDGGVSRVGVGREAGVTREGVGSVGECSELGHSLHQGGRGEKRSNQL